MRLVGVHSKLWFQAFIGAMPKGLLTADQLRAIRKEYPSADDQYAAVKALVLETYVNIHAHQQAREKLEAMIPTHGIDLVSMADPGEIEQYRKWSRSAEEALGLSEG